MAALANEVREQLSRYLSGEVQPDAFQNWFALVLRDVHKSGDREAEALAYSVEWAFLDLERGLSSPAELRENLSHLAAANESVGVRHYVVSVYGEASYFTTGTSTDVVPQDVRFGQPFGIGPSLVSV